LSTRNTKPNQDPPERQIDRIERLAAFGSELASALRTEFFYYWELPARRQQVPQAEEFAAKVDVLRELSARFMRQLRVIRTMPPVQGLAACRALDTQALFDASQGLDVMARGLREHGRRRGWGSHDIDVATPVAASVKKYAPVAPAAPAQPDSLTGRLKGWLTNFDAKNTAPLPTAETTPESVGGRRLAAFEASLELVVSLRDNLLPKMRVLRAAQLQRDGKGEEAPAVQPEYNDMVQAIASEIEANVALQRAIEIALGQWQQIVQQLPAFEKARAQARSAPPEQVAKILLGHDLGKLKGVMLPLTNLHITFRAFATTAALFQGPETVMIETALPSKERAVSKPKEEDPVPEEDAEEKPAEDAPKGEKPQVDWRTWRESADGLSRKRLTLLMGFMKNPEDRSVLKDNSIVYRLIAEETTYQKDREIDRRMQLRLMLTSREGDPKDRAERKAKLEKEMQEAKTMLAQLEQLGKFVSKKGL
jgi:hypothetical protein